MTEFNESKRAGLNSKSASRAADREIIANALCEIAEKHGAHIERRNSDPSPGYCGQGIVLRFRLNGVGAMIDIDNLHGGKWALISWYNEADPKAYENWPDVRVPVLNFSKRFGVCVGEESSWPRLHHKATSFPNDWYSAAMFLDGGLTLAARGEAFEQQEEVA